jgi:UDP-glucose 4-epimerase
MIKYKCLNLVYSSSATVYGTPETIPIPETSPVQPESVYGRSKGMCEDIIKDVCLAERSFNAVSLRYFKYVVVRAESAGN